MKGRARGQKAPISDHRDHGRLSKAPQVLSEPAEASGVEVNSQYQAPLLHLFGGSGGLSARCAAEVEDPLSWSGVEARDDQPCPLSLNREPAGFEGLRSEQRPDFGDNEVALDKG